MSKKQKRLIRRARKQQNTNNGQRDCHHIFYQRRNWSRGALTVLRQFHYCKVYLPKNTVHRMIHVCVGNISPPKPVNADEALKQLRCLEKYGAISDSDGIEKRLKVLIALFDEVEPGTTLGLKRQLAVVREHKPS